VLNEKVHVLVFINYWSFPIQGPNIPRTKSHALFRCLGRTRVSIQVMFRNKASFYTSLNTQAGGPPLVCCTQLFIQFIRSYPPYWRPFLQPQLEEAPCLGDRDPLITGVTEAADKIPRLILELWLFHWMRTTCEIKTVRSFSISYSSHLLTTPGCQLKTPINLGDMFHT